MPTTMSTMQVSPMAWCLLSSLASLQHKQAEVRGKAKGEDWWAKAADGRGQAKRTPAR